MTFLDTTMQAITRLEAERLEREQLEARLKAEATRGDALWEELAAALDWTRADARANPGVQGYQKRLARLELAVAQGQRRT